MFFFVIIASNEKICLVVAKLLDYDYMGYLMKQGGSFKSWKKRLCILHTGRLYYYKKKTDILPKGMINVTGLTCDHVLDDKLVSGRPYGLKIISPHRTYYVCADSQEDADLWCMCFFVSFVFFVAMRERELFLTHKFFFYVILLVA